MARFLVIDDDATMRTLMVSTLESAGHNVAAAASGAEATACFETAKPQVVITDVVLPDNTLDRVIALRQAHPEVVFILVSGTPDSERALDAIKLLDARRMLPKPFRLPDLLDAAEQVAAELKPAKKGWQIWR